MTRARTSAAVLVGLLLVLGLVADPVSAQSPRTASTDPTAARATAPAVNAIRIFGRSVKGRALRAYRVGDPTSVRKVVILATMHGNEPGPARILMNLVNGAPISGADIWLIPYLNRDGLARHTRKNARGVDLNRNWPVRWVKRKGHYNSGRRPASEPETRALMRFLGNVRPTWVISLHQPLHGVDTSYGKARNLAIRLVKGLDLPAKVFNCTSGCHGTMTQWFNKVQPGAALTVEYGGTMTKRQVNVTGPTGLLSAVYATR